jgi:hypothetical protein
MSLIGLLLILLIFCVVIWAARALMGAFGVGDPIATVVYVLLVLVALIWLLNTFGYGGALLGGGTIGLRR